VVDGSEVPSPANKIDNFRNRIGVEVEWNQAAECFDRGIIDLTNE